MEHARPSHTALRVAMRRAAHQLFDDRPLVFDDPIAVAILGPHAAEVERTPGRNPENKPRPFSIALRAFLVARSRYAEDLLANAVQRGITQYVLLGAGLDTFAHRNPYPHLRVFEVDHPATQVWKHELLLTSNLATPANLTYAPVDFERQSLAEQLLATGFNPATPTFFAWLGVVPYLTCAAFRATLAFIGAQPPGSGVVFDYSQPRSALPPREQLAFDSLAARVSLAGEAFQLFFTPAQVAAELAAFYDLEDLGSPEINQRYFANRTDGLRLMGSTGRLVSAFLNSHQNSGILHLIDVRRRTIMELDESCSRMEVGMASRTSLLFLAVCWPGIALAGQAAPGTNAAPAPIAPVNAAPPSATLRPSLDVLKTALSELKVDKWKASTAIRDEAQSNLGSVQRDVASTLPSLLAAADAAPNSAGKVLPVYRNVEALYDVVLRLDAAARLAAPGDQMSALDQALARLDDGRRALGDQLQGTADAQDNRVIRLEAALKAVPPPLPPPPPPAPPKCPATPVKKKAAAKPSTRPAGTQPSTQPSH